MTTIEITCAQCLDQRGNLDRRVQRWVDLIASYTELAPDINGIRIYAQAELPDYMHDLDPVDSTWRIQRLS